MHRCSMSDSIVIYVLCLYIAHLILKGKVVLYCKVVVLIVFFTSFPITGTVFRSILELYGIATLWGSQFRTQTWLFYFVKTEYSLKHTILHWQQNFTKPNTYIYINSTSQPSSLLLDFIKDYFSLSH